MGKRHTQCTEISAVVSMYKLCVLAKHCTVMVCVNSLATVFVYVLESGCFCVSVCVQTVWFECCCCCWWEQCRICRHISVFTPCFNLVWVLTSPTVNIFIWWYDRLSVGAIEHHSHHSCFQFQHAMGFLVVPAPNDAFSMNRNKQSEPIYHPNCRLMSFSWWSNWNFLLICQNPNGDNTHQNE